jgi:hypothetical protein
MHIEYMGISQIIIIIKIEFGWEWEQENTWKILIVRVRAICLVSPG